MNDIIASGAIQGLKSLFQKKTERNVIIQEYNDDLDDIDEYIAGETTLNEFLRDTEYYKRWKFDYNLYK